MHALWCCNSWTSTARIDRYIGYDPVVHLDKDNANDQILGILEHIEDYQELVDRNRQRALEHGDWKVRIEWMMGVMKKQGYEV